MGAIVGASITYRLAFGPNAGRKALTLQTVPVRTEQRRGDDLVTKQAGFSLHAGIACKSNQRKKLERLWLGAPAGTLRGQLLRRSAFPLPTTATSSSR